MHEITEGTRVVTVGESAWHRIENNFPVGTRMTAEEAVNYAGMDDGIERAFPTVVINGETITLPEKATFLRKPDGTLDYIGTQGAEFTPLSNMELARLIDGSGVTKEYPIETAGSLKGGKWVFFTMNVGMTTIGGENVGQYMAVNDGKDGTRSLSLIYTAVREVCANTVAMAEAGSRLQLQLTHRPGVAQDFALAMDLMLAIKQTTAAMRERFEALTRKKLNAAKIKLVMDAAYPYKRGAGRTQLADQLKADGKLELLAPEKRKPLEHALKYEANAEARALERRAAALANLERIQSNSELLNPALRGTAWAVWNAVTEIENHRDGWGNVAESILVGERAQAMQRALVAAERA